MFLPAIGATWPAVPNCGAIWRSSRPNFAGTETCCWWLRDEGDEIVALTGIANVVVSLERCRQATCPIKDLLAGRDERLGLCAPCMSIAVRNIPGLDLPDTLLLSEI
jgi:hypothetical protein